MSVGDLGFEGVPVAVGVVFLGVPVFVVPDPPTFPAPTTEPVLTPDVTPPPILPAFVTAPV